MALKCVESHIQWTWKQKRKLISMNCIFSVCECRLGVQWQTHWCKSKINPEPENAGEEHPLSAASDVTDQRMKRKEKQAKKQLTSHFVSSFLPCLMPLKSQVKCLTCTAMMVACKSPYCLELGDSANYTAVFNCVKQRSLCSNCLPTTAEEY